MAVQTDDHQDEGGGLHSEELQKAQQLTESVAGVPLHRHVPHHVQRHHHEGHHQVGRRQAEDERTQVRRQTPATAARHADEERQITDGGEDEEDHGGRHSSLSRRGEGGRSPVRQRRQQRCVRHAQQGRVIGHHVALIAT